MIRKKMPKVPPPWRFATSFSKVMLGLVLLLLSVVLLRSVFTSSDTTTSHKEGNSKERNLKFVGRSHNEEEQPKDEYLEVLREEPRASLSLSSSLDKFLAEERQKHNPGRRVPLREEPSLTVGGAAPANIDQGDILNLKTALRDPAFVNKIKKVEDRRQELYLKILRNKGQVVVGEDGGQTIVSYPQTPVKFPNNMKKNLADWSEKEKIWLNITHFPWPTESEECRRYSVQFSRAGDLPVVGLASYPSSGNTWLRYLIEGVTGYYTGSMYNDISLRKKGFYGEGVPADAGLVLTVKTHGHTTGPGAHVADKVKVEYNHHTEVNHSAILLIRNPYKAIIGHRNLDSGGHTGFAKEEQFQGPGWQEFVEIKAAHWLHFYKDWLENNPLDNLLVLHYENIQQNPEFSLRKIAGFLGFQAHQGRIDCAVNFSTGQFKRKHKDIGKNPFTQQQKEIVEQSIRKLNRLLKDCQKESLPLSKYGIFDESEHQNI